jgi:hypothetical protein
MRSGRHASGKEMDMARPMALARRFAAVACALSLSLPALAQQGPGAGSTKRNYNTELKSVAEGLGKRLNVTIVVDPFLAVAAKPIEPNAARIEEALDALVAGMKGATWRKAYRQQAEANAVPSADKLCAAVRALDVLEQTGLVVENNRTRRATLYSKDFPVPANFADELQGQRFTTTPLYVIYATSTGASAGGATTADRFFDLQKQQMALMMEMSPEQMAQAMSQSMQMFMNMDPGTRSQFMGNMMRAGIQMWSSLPADQRQQMVGQLMQNAQQAMGQAGQGGGRRP